MDFINIYKPNTQKSLFHKDIISHIRKWIVYLDNLLTNNKPVKKILLLSGPSGCGKTATIDVLFKSYNIIKYDSNDFNSTKKMEENFINLLDVNTKTLENIEKWNHKNQKDKPNIILIDNIELLEINLYDIIDYIHINKNINISIILCGNISISDQKTKKNDDITYIKMSPPSLLELTKLGLDIITDHKLKLNKVELKKIIDFCDFDIRQFLFILNQWKLNPTDVNDFLKSLQLKDKDIDMTTKLTNIFNNDFNYSFSYFFNTCYSEPITITNNIYQNYITNISNKNPSGMTDILECLSHSDKFQKKMFDEQCWELYEDYTAISCVSPIYHIKQNLDTDNKTILVPHKEISFNYYNSFQEVKKICMENHANNYLNNLINNSHNKNFKIYSNLFKDFTISEYFMVTKNLFLQINKISRFFDINKKGKNTSKKEKLDLTILMKSDQNIYNLLNDIADFILNYRLFTIDNDKLHLYIDKSNEKYDIHNSVDKIEIKIFKRFLNIFNLQSENIQIKSHVEFAIKYQILLFLSDSFELNSKTSNCINREIDNMVVSLDSIWNF